MSSDYFDPKEWMSQADAARLRGVSRQSIALLIKKGRLNVLEVGGKRLVRRQEVESFRPDRAGRPSK